MLVVQTTRGPLSKLSNYDEKHIKDITQDSKFAVWKGQGPTTMFTPGQLLVQPPQKVFQAAIKSAASGAFPATQKPAKKIGEKTWNCSDCENADYSVSGS